MHFSINNITSYKFFQEELLEIESEILTDREIQILEKLCNGYSPKEIADIF
ncbi:MAG: hypothetical protein KA146_09440 [Leptospiraceae bacterium]|nr:hypothetical protein [Leptospiraceae bacterium]